MDAYLELTQRINSRFNDCVVGICADFFKYFNLNHFWYFRITDHGELSFVGTNAEWCEVFAEEKFYLRYPNLKHSSILPTGVFLRKNVQNPDLKPISIVGADKFEMRQSLVILSQVESGTEEWGFVSPSATDEQTSLFLNELPLFKFFMDKFRLENRKLLNRLWDDPINVSKLIGPFFYEGLISTDETYREQLIKRLGMPSPNTFSCREVEVMKLLLRGYSASQVGLEIHLSKRTVEHHIERIKSKLGCYSKVELLQKAKELEQVGLL